MPPDGRHDLVAADFAQAADFAVVIARLNHAQGKPAAFVQPAGLVGDRGDILGADDGTGQGNIRHRCRRNRIGRDDGRQLLRIGAGHAPGADVQECQQHEAGSKHQRGQDG